MAIKSVMSEAREITLAIELIELGARLQMLEAEVNLSRDRLIRLYKEVRGVSPPKGMLPFSTDWFMTWQPNVHASLFYNMFCFMRDEAGCDAIQSTIKAYRLYVEHVMLNGSEEPLLGLTRAWTLLRFFDSGMLSLQPCSRCGGKFVTHAHEPSRGAVCGLCQPPSRAGKTRAAAESKRVAEARAAEPIEVAPEALAALAQAAQGTPGTVCAEAPTVVQTGIGALLAAQTTARRRRELRGHH
ncbi:flagellar transcriptional activator FlhC [Chitinasiproducens palmae]|uniref:Flagellar transcriptional regulator FlhC n=1 Tax=Chitinasiproducens palmae TaxID=1770053 RepID=A0A1H2PLV3_9BURK|nr:flagellar transcriptional activator FlhC [Chitinasiproducens palmae]